MKIGFVGLGKMGANMCERLLSKGHKIVAFDFNEQAKKTVREKGAEVADSLEEMVSKLESPRLVWIMVPSGEPTENTVNSLANLLTKDDILIDGGNTLYKDSIRRAENLRSKQIHFLDAGTSGGVWGLKLGYCLMVGGEEAAFKLAEPIFEALAPEKGYAHVGPSGAGHFVKMVHNGIEYALLQAYGEGFEILKTKDEFNFNLKGIANLWNQGSVIRSWLLELAELAFDKDDRLSHVCDFVSDSGEGRWSVAAAIEENVPAPVITLSLLERFRSRQEESFSAKLIAALRDQFGGHGIKKSK